MTTVNSGFPAKMKSLLQGKHWKKYLKHPVLELLGAICTIATVVGGVVAVAGDFGDQPRRIIAAQLTLREGPFARERAYLFKDSRVLGIGDAVVSHGRKWLPVRVEGGWIAAERTDGTGSKLMMSTNGGQILEGQDAIIVYNGRDGVNLRDEPKIMGSIHATFGKGTQVHVIDGPEVRDGYVWWEIDDIEGVLSEGFTRDE